MDSFLRPVAGDAVNNTLYCDAVNTRTKPLTITIDGETARDFDDAALDCIDEPKVTHKPRER